MRFACFFDWHSWSLGIEAWLWGDLHRADDPLGSMRKLTILLGPLVIAFGWPAW